MSDAGDKLARTRLAIVEHVWQRKHGGDPREHREGAKHAAVDRAVRQEERAEGAAKDEYEQARRHGAGWFGSVKRAAGTWWRHHPAHMGVELATPMLSAYAARRPATYLAAAAVLGAVIVVARPWRLISATGLIVAIVKSSQLSSVLMSAMSAADFDRNAPPFR